MTATLSGAIRSKLMWLGALSVALPELVAQLGPLLGAVIGPELWARVVQIVGVLVIVLRFFTTSSLADKAAPAEPADPPQQGRIAPLLLVMLAIVSTACAALVAPRSFDQSLAYGYGNVTAVRQSCADALQRARLDVPEGQQCLDLTDQARAALDLARAASGRGDSSTAAGQLQLATSVLTQLDAMLRARGVTK